MLRRNGYRPDTCRCRFEIEWDDEATEAARTHTFLLVEPCADHSAVSPVDAESVIVRGENQRKNKIISELASRVQVKPDEIAFRFGTGRSLIVTPPASARAAAGLARAAMRAQHGEFEVE